jgi:predicted  nucleic acid-binding Zn-ribbon protein
MRQAGPSLVVGAQKTVSGMAIVFLVAAACFGFLNTQKMKMLRADVANAHAARDAAERRAAHETLDASTDGTRTVDGNSKMTDAENRATKAETELAQIQNEKADLQSTLDASQQQLASLQQRVEQLEKNPAVAAHTAELQSQVDDLRHQVDAAEKEKALLAEKLQDSQERTSQTKEAKKHRETASGQRESGSVHRAGVRGAVLAYNQAYNFVVLNLGARNGVETNSDMLVLRDGTLIGKIRISSVEPATAIGDIITSSLARGVQVQPGDTVIYAGTNP